MASASASSSGSSGSARFDEKVYEHSASKIRYRWSFLAKSHIASKTRPVPANSGGSAGSVAAAKTGTFGCMFCCFENDRSVIAYGGLNVFMNHIGEAHRGFRGDLLGNTRCVIGRVAGVEESFDINIPPL